MELIFQWGYIDRFFHNQDFSHKRNILSVHVTINKSGTGCLADAEVLVGCTSFQRFPFLSVAVTSHDEVLTYL